jgi:HD-like signal output (HDOD) protein
MQSQKEIAREIEKNPALVAKLLRISNSVFYGTRKQISNVYEAITFIGTEFVLSIVLGLESFDSFNHCNDQSIIEMIEELREASIIRAHLAREISIRWSKKNEQHEIYVAALLLDIGIILRLCSAQDKNNEFYETYKSQKKPIYLIDKQIYTATHDEVGAALLTYWNFPSRIISAIANHHSYTGDDTFTTIIQLADALVQRKDSYPHDPGIDEYLREWEPKMSSTIEELQETNNIFE